MTGGEWAKTYGPRGALFTPDDTCRTLLWRTWASGLDLDRTGFPAVPDTELLGVVMKNPSKANAEKDDATIRVVSRVAREAGASGILVGNLVPYIATNPKDMLRWLDRHRLNDHQGAFSWNASALNTITQSCSRVLVAWGRLENGTLDALAVHCLARLGSSELLTLGKNADGTPHHPLRCKLDGLKPFHDLEAR